jgi:hypothetical protein
MCREKPKKGLGFMGIMTLCGGAKHGHGLKIQYILAPVSKHLDIIY